MNTNTSLQGIVKKVTNLAQDRDRVSVGDVLDTLGRRSFGPLLVFLGLVLAVPGVGDIPGVPVIFGAMILMTVGQQFFGRTYIWLPDWLLRRSMKQKYVEKTLHYSQKPAQFVDSLTAKRMAILVNNKLVWYCSAFACLTIALMTPAMEVVLLSANVAGVCLFLFGLAYVARDGLIMLVSFLLYGGLISLLVWGLFL